DGAARHIRLGTEAHVVCVAPATADFLARAAQGRADDLLSTTLLVTRAPVLLCPAMNDRMWAHPQVVANARHCRDALGYHLLGPAQGPLAVGEAEGPGRLVEPDEIVEHLGRLLGAGGPLAGRRVLITSGPTREALDPVRYLGNRSSGRMGYALAAAAWRRGAQVTVVTGPTALPDPTGVEVVPVESALQMDAAVRDRVGEADVVIYAAAVADYRPAEPGERKRKRGRDGEEWGVAFTANPDIAAGTRALRKPGAVAVGFALETEDLLANAAAKREAKGFDLVVANPAGDPEAGFGVETNRVTLLGDGQPEALPVMGKDEVADRILDRVEGLLGGR
ncbi:MAG TPA: bifunctional phosphopantothenoylcysteine decarboxylase/phosphopantothenate--cysteine ligase CoaBC, partial [Longimicrobiales bacterium]|nr:bifunctional phosphopantothenoylcysteine decarboxylase/phosphopantothenate--cysteine ligase CoaBC [Longimicrobiales bacterium]